MNRRKFLKVTGMGALTTIAAGCTGQNGNGGGETTTGGKTTTTTTEETTTEKTTPADGSLQTKIGRTPQNVTISNLKINRSSGEGATLTGTLKYTGNKQLEEVEVQATLLDKNDDVLGKFFDNSESKDFEGPLKKGETWKFNIRFEDADLGQAARVRIDVDTDVDQNVNVGEQTATDGNLQTHVGRTPQNVTISNLKINRSAGEGAVLTGTLKYTGNQQLEEVEVQATLYDDSDDVLGKFFDNSQSESFGGPLQSGETWDFRIQFEDADLGQAAGVQVDVDTDVDQNVDVNLNTSAGNETTMTTTTSN